MEGMLQIQAKQVGTGWHPDQVLLAIDSAAGGQEFVSADKTSWNGVSLRVSRIIETRHDGAVLIELPREAESGTWRIWVRPEKIQENAKAA